MIQSVTYTEPVLYHYSYNLSKAWFVGFEITNESTGETKRKQFRGGINYWPDKQRRLRAGNALIKYWKSRLENGWHPFDKVEQALITSQTPFDQALDFALEKCSVASKTKSGYKGTVKFAKAAAKVLGFSRLPVSKVTQPHIMLILEKAKSQRTWSNKAYNKHLGYLCAVISRLKEWKAIPYNPAEDIKTLPVAETQKFIPLTDKEKKKLRDELFIRHYGFFVYLMVIYHVGLRPKEILALRIRDVDLRARLITVYPDLDRENSKTKNIRKVPINGYLLQYLQQMDLSIYPEDYYVFGSPFEAGKGNQGLGTKHPRYFKPNPTMIKRDTVTRLWKKIVNETLGINKYMYSLKHTGSDDKIMAGIDLDALKELYGHSSKYMTEKYARKVKEIYRSQIEELSPEF